MITVEIDDGVSDLASFYFWQQNTTGSVPTWVAA